MRIAWRRWLVVVLAILAWPAFLSAAGDKSEPKPANPRALFRVLGVGDDSFDRLADGTSISGEEQPTLMRIVFRLRLFPAADVDRWALPPYELPTAEAHTKVARGSIYQLRGRVVEVEPVRPPVAAAARYELPKYYRCRLELDETGRDAIVFAEDVPKAWQRGAKPNEAAGAMGVFLKLGENKTPTFAASRLAWYPDTPLGQLGMDVGLFDRVKDYSPLSADDNEAFYQMLAAVGRVESGRLSAEAEAALPTVAPFRRRVDKGGTPHYYVKPLFNEPAKERGQLVELTGTARRIEEIHIDDPALAARLGTDHYYQVSLFTDDSYDTREMPSGEVRSTPQPLTFCVREIPRGMPYGNVSNYGETVRIAGFFFKCWTYKVPRVSDSSEEPGTMSPEQVSPLLIGRDLSWQPMPKASDNLPTNIVLGAGFLVVMAVLRALAWQNRLQTRRRRAAETQRIEIPKDLESTTPRIGPPTFPES